MEKIDFKNMNSSTSVVPDCERPPVEGMEQEKNPSSISTDIPGYDPAYVKKYDFVKWKIPRVRADDTEADHIIMSGRPVVITDSGLIDSARHWDLKYLSEHMGSGLNFVFQSRNHKFMYFDEKRLSQWPAFVQPTTKHEVKFSDFVTMLDKFKDCKDRIYLQQTLNDTVGKNIVQDFVQFRWDWCTKYQRMCHWGSLTSNLLLIGMEGNVTPCHYDEQENFFAQISGYKHITLLAPDQFESLYPYPLSHPCDRQSQVDFDNPDYEKFPKFRNAKAYEAIVGPGDVLYIPMYWWHNIESVKTEHPNTTHRDAPVTVSVNFWYKATSPTPKLQSSLTDQQKVAVMRNIEKMLGQVIDDPQEVGKLLRTITDGRYGKELFENTKKT